MPTTYRTRPAACSQCDDVVLVAEQSAGTLFGTRIGKPTTWLEHADPGPDGDVFDAVDAGCSRPRVVRYTRGDLTVRTPGSDAQ